MRPIKLRCPNCRSNLPEIDLNSIREGVQCSCGENFFPFRNGYLDMMPNAQNEGIQLDHIPRFFSKANPYVHIVYSWAYFEAKFAPRFANLVREFSPADQGRRLLDIGLGIVTKRRLRLHYRAIGDSINLYFGLDPSSRQLESHNQDEAERCLFVRAIAENIPFSDNEFDVILVLSTLDHVSNLTRAIDEISRVLQDKGLLVVGLNNDKSWFKKLFKKHAAHVREKASEEHNVFFSVEDVLSLFGDKYSLVHEHHWRYLPVDSVRFNIPVLREFCFSLLQGADRLGRFVLPRKGGNFYLFLVKKDGTSA